MASAGLDPTVAEKVNQLIRLSGGRLRIVSGFRSVDRQKQLWSAALKKYGSAKAARQWVAPPGKSNHGRGLAVDIGPAGGLSAEEAHALIAKLAPKVGLHTPMKWEPWHVEPIGHKGSKDAYTAPPAPTTTAPATPAAPEDPAANRKDLGVQLSTLMNILSGPLGGIDGNA